MSVKAVSLPNLVYDILKDEILYLHLKPGTMLGEIETSKRLNVSRTPTRDAFKKLANEGLLEIKAHVGTFVSLIDLDQIGDILYMREKVELAIMHDLMHCMSQVQVFKISLVLQQQKELLERVQDGEVLAKAFIKLDNDFHASLFEMAGKLRVWKQLSSFEQHSERFRMFINLINKDHLTKLYEEHVLIFEAIKTKQSEVLSNIYQKHLYSGITSASAKILENAHYFINYKVE